MSLLKQKYKPLDSTLQPGQMKKKLNFNRTVTFSEPEMATTFTELFQQTLNKDIFKSNAKNEKQITDTDVDTDTIIERKVFQWFQKQYQEQDKEFIDQIEGDQKDKQKLKVESRGVGTSPVSKSNQKCQVNSLSQKFVNESAKINMNRST